MARAPRYLAFVFSVCGAGSGWGDVLQHHNHQNRDGLYVDPLFTRAASRTIHRDSNFQAPLPGPTLAQPLYVSSGPSGAPALIAATEQNDVLALDAATGTTLWTVNLGTPIPLDTFDCGNIDPVGITGTPVIDIDSRAIYLNAMVTQDAGDTKQHFVYALSLDDGSTLPDWPVEISSSLHYGGFSFNAGAQNQRGGLILSGGILYVPYGGYFNEDRVNRLARHIQAALDQARAEERQRELEKVDVSWSDRRSCPTADTRPVRPHFNH